MNYTNFSINFLRDWIELLKNDLSNINYNTDNLSDEEIQIHYFNLKRRSISPTKRNILKSREFSIPTEKLPALKKLEEKIKNGEDINPHLSKNILKLDYNDMLFNHWGIQHLHLGEELESNGFIKRDGPLLYAQFDEGVAYFIDVRNHGHWTDQDLIQIIHNNWPKKIAEYRLQRITDTSHKITDADVLKLRKYNINPTIQVSDGTTYFPPGGGSTCSGVGTEVVSLMLSARRKIASWQKLIENNVEKITSDAMTKGVKLSKTHHIRLRREESKAYAVEENKLFSFELGSLNDIQR